MLRVNGFAALTNLFDPGDIRRVEPVLDRLLLSDGRGLTARFRQELSNDPSAISQPEVLRPAVLAPMLRNNAVFAKCRELALSLLACRAHYLFDHAIYKMPHGHAETPWHQDLAYIGQFAASIRSLHFWIPLQDTGVEAGAMRFIPGSHTWPLLAHVRAYQENPHVLTATVGPHPEPIPVPLRLGGACVHTPLTLHGATANTTDQVRKAWIVHFGDRPLWYKQLLKYRATLSRFR